MPYYMNCIRVLGHFKEVLHQGERACLLSMLAFIDVLPDACLVIFAMNFSIPSSNAATWRLPLHTLHVCHAADNLCLKIGDEFPDEKVLFMSDILCTAWHGTELGRVGKGDTVAIWGQGLVGLHTSRKCTAMHLFTQVPGSMLKKPPAPSGVIVGCSDKPA